MKSGIELIAAERKEQIVKHNRTVESDLRENNDRQLSAAASWLCVYDWGCIEEETVIEDQKPPYWDENIWAKMVRKPYKKRLIIAAALIAAEIDRLNAIEEQAVTGEDKI